MSHFMSQNFQKYEKRRENLAFREIRKNRKTLLNSGHFAVFRFSGGDNRTRTCDLLYVKQAL